MSSNWEKVYPERINWTNRGGPPLDENNLNKGDKALREIDDRVISVGVINDYILEPSKWNLASGPEDIYYRYVYSIDEAGVYKNDSSPMAIVMTTGENESDEEHNSISYIGKVWVDENGVRVYATTPPTVELKLRIRGN